MKAWHHCFTSLELLLTEGFDVVEIILNWKDSLPGKHWSGLKSVSKSSWGKIGLMGAVSLCGQTCDALKRHHSWALAAAVEGSDRKWDLTMERKEKCPKERLKQRFEQHDTARWLGVPTVRCTSPVHEIQESCEALGTWFKANFSWWNLRKMNFCVLILVLSGINIRKEMS